MSQYAYVENGVIVEFKEISDDTYNSWVSSGNPKKDFYKIVVFNQSPIVSDSEVATYVFEIGINSVTQVWSVRNKNADELRKTYTAYQFMLRFTSEERTAYRNAAKTDDNVADFMSLAQAAQEIINDDPMTVAGMNYLVSLGIISEARKNEILG
jgi:hypothetical protein